MPAAPAMRTASQTFVDLRTATAANDSTSTCEASAKEILLQSQGL
jgi:hypothetical protein